MQSSSLVLGIETSCDETAAALVAGGRNVLANVIASQIAVHAPYGGVVPEIASREHLRQITPIVREALRQANVTLDDICAIAVTEGPGLAGALFVGIAYAKALVFAAGKPLIAVNHLEGHIHSALMASDPGTGEKTSALALVVSGGHTHLYLATRKDETWSYNNVGRTVDDAAGEAFDKAAKMLGLGYPGGPWIAALAEHGNSRAVPFSFAQVKAKGHGRRDADPDLVLFSFSGIKTAVARYIELHGMAENTEKRRRAVIANPDITVEQMLPLCDTQTLDLAASFQRAVVEDLVRKTMRAAERCNAKHLLVTGGVAANLQLRKRFTEEAEKRGLTASFPAPGLSTDNAAMIAAAAWPKYLAGDFAAADLSGQPGLRL